MTSCLVMIRNETVVSQLHVAVFIFALLEHWNQRQMDIEVAPFHGRLVMALATGCGVKIAHWRRDQDCTSRVRSWTKPSVAFSDPMRGFRTGFTQPPITSPRILSTANPTQWVCWCSPRRWDSKQALYERWGKWKASHETLIAIGRHSC